MSTQPRSSAGSVIAEFRAEQISRGITGELVRGWGGLRFSRVSTDSRSAAPGSLFVAIRGDRFDGHNYVADAAAQGAAGAVVQVGARRNLRLGRQIALIEVEDTLRALGDLARLLRRAHPVPLVAVTGSCGKTTTKELLYAALTVGGHRVLKSEGNYNNQIGVPLTLFKLERQHEAVVIEMGMNRLGEIARLTEICEPDVGLITCVAAAHTEGLGDIDGVARAKGELFSGLRGSAWAAVNLDDARIADMATLARRLTFTTRANEKADVHGTLLADRGLEGIDFELDIRGKTAEVHLALLGEHNLHNALAAATAAFALKVPVAEIAAGLASYRPFAKRLHPSLAPGGWWVINDAYNANPASMAAGLRAASRVAETTQGRLFAALGEMLELGAVADDAHREVGLLCGELRASVLAYLAEGRGALYGEGAAAAGVEAIAAPSCEEIARRLRACLRPGDVVLVKGSRRTGMERVAEALLEPEAAHPSAAV